MHDATKVLLGAATTNCKDVTDHVGSPATYKAGLAVRQGSSALSLLKSAGGWLGISLGKGLSDAADHVALARSGFGIPVLLERQPARGVIEITNYSNLLSGGADTITVGLTVFTAQSSAVTPGDGTFRAATGNTETAASLAAQINAHAVAGLLVKATSALGVVTLTAISNATDADTIAMAYTEGGTGTGATVSGATLTDSDDSSDWALKGSKVYFSDTTGKADDPNSGATISDAVYVSGILAGIQEDGTEVAVALVDMPGGL